MAVAFSVTAVCAYYRERLATDRTDRKGMRAAPAPAPRHLIRANLYPAA